MRENQDSLDRFISVQDQAYETALTEIRRGRKESHWIWFIFPQLKELGRSGRALFYGISGLEEARRYLAHPVLRARLEEISGALLTLDTNDPQAVMGYPDVLKLRSSMTLFAHAAGPGSVYAQVLDKFYGGAEDELTVRLLRDSAK